MLAKLYMNMCHAFPKFRKATRKQMYQFMARYYQKRDWSFMNFGYAPEDAAEAPVLQSDDEINRYCIQLYHHVVSAVDLRGLKVLEVGSGRGGGADYIKRYLGPAWMIGVDFSDRAVSLCRQYYHVEGLSFVPGDAEHLPFDDESFDAVVNVESSHCYGSMTAFLAQVRRVLKPGGHFLFADFRPRERIDELDEQLAHAALQPIRQKNITANVIKALDADHERRIAHIRRGAPKLLVKLIQEFAGIKGAEIYKRFQSGAVVYKSFVLQKV
ncbi:MAG: methyltransferase domain-containing protein [Anaerolineae bacterium]